MGIFFAQKYAEKSELVLNGPGKMKSGKQKNRPAFPQDDSFKFDYFNFISKGSRGLSTLLSGHPTVF